MNIELITLFQLNILSGYIEKIDNQKILEELDFECDRLSENEIESNYEDFKISFSEEIKKISNNIVSDYEKLSNNQETLELLGHWAHVHEYNESCNTHCHMCAQDIIQGPHLSAVYYVKVPQNSGKLVFDFEVSKYEKNRYTVNPEVGKYILFPSHLDHFVTKNKNKDKRVSISFNYRKIIL